MVAQELFIIAQKNLNYRSKVRGIKVIRLPSAKDHKLSEMADVTMRLSQARSYMIQEHYLRIYHGLCLMFENGFFGE